MIIENYNWVGDYITVMSFQIIFFPKQYFLLTVTVSAFRATVIGDKKMAKRCGHIQ